MKTFSSRIQSQLTQAGFHIQKCESTSHYKLYMNASEAKNVNAFIMQSKALGDLLMKAHKELGVGG
jgi:hypothetical protein